MKKIKLTKRFFIIIFALIALIIISIILINKARNGGKNNKENTDIPNKDPEAFVYTGNNFSEESTSNLTENEYKMLEEEIEYKGLVISNITFRVVGERSCEVKANVQNNTGDVILAQIVNLVIYDKDGNIMSRIGAQIGSMVKNGHIELVTNTRLNDVSEIASVKIEEVS